MKDLGEAKKMLGMDIEILKSARFG